MTDSPDKPYGVPNCQNQCANPDDGGSETRHKRHDMKHSSQRAAQLPAADGECGKHPIRQKRIQPPSSPYLRCSREYCPHYSTDSQDEKLGSPIQGKDARIHCMCLFKRVKLLYNQERGDYKWLINDMFTLVRTATIHGSVRRKLYNWTPVS